MVADDSAVTTTRSGGVQRSTKTRSIDIRQMAEIRRLAGEIVRDSWRKYMLPCPICTDNVPLMMIDGLEMKRPICMQCAELLVYEYLMKHPETTKDAFFDNRDDTTGEKWRMPADVGTRIMSDIGDEVFDDG